MQLILDDVYEIPSDHAIMGGHDAIVEMWFQQGMPVNGIGTELDAGHLAAVSMLLNIRYEHRLTS